MFVMWIDRLEGREWGRRVDSYMVLNDVIVIACPGREPRKCESGAVVIQSDSVKKIVRVSRSSFRRVRFVVEGKGERLRNETLHHNSSSSPVPQATPPVAKTGTIDIGRSGVKFVGSSPTPSFTINTDAVRSGILQPPVTILTLLRLVRIPARL